MSTSYLIQRSKQEFMQFTVILYLEEKAGILFRTGKFIRIKIVCCLFVFSGIYCFAYICFNHASTAKFHLIQGYDSIM